MSLRSSRRAVEPVTDARPSPPSPAREERIRVLHVLSTLLPGGSELSVLRLVGALDAHRYRTSVAYLRGEPVLRRDFESAGAEVVPVALRSHFDPLCLLRLRALVARGRHDLVHTHMDVADFYGALAGRLGGARAIVSTKHAPDEFRTRRTWKRYPFLVLERLAYEMDDAVIVVSEGLAHFLETVERLPRRKMVVIGHGVEAAPAFAPRAEARSTLALPALEPLIGCVGRLSPEKGHAYLLQALPAIVAAFPRAGCVLAGDGPSRQALEDEARRLGVADRVVFLGHRGDVPGILSALDLFVQPSLYEGFGMSLLEAMAARLPIVASRVGGIPEVIDDQATGLLVPPADAPSLARAVIALLGDRGRAQRYAEAGARRVAERHSMASVATRVDALYRRVLGGAS